MRLLGIAVACLLVGCAPVSPGGASLPSPAATMPAPATSPFASTPPPTPVLVLTATPAATSTPTIEEACKRKLQQYDDPAAVLDLIPRVPVPGAPTAVRASNIEPGDYEVFVSAPRSNGEHNERIGAVTVGADRVLATTVTVPKGFVPTGDCLVLVAARISISEPRVRSEMFFVP
ncbi:MAG: hypothetical protein AB7G21_08215 [Dehalococcoidia bacterium]